MESDLGVLNAYNTFSNELLIPGNIRHIYNKYDLDFISQNPS